MVVSNPPGGTEEARFEIEIEIETGEVVVLVKETPAAEDREKEFSRSGKMPASTKYCMPFFGLRLKRRMPTFHWQNTVPTDLFICKTQYQRICLFAKHSTNGFI